MLIDPVSLENISIESFHPELEGVYIGTTHAVPTASLSAAGDVELPAKISLPVQTHTCNVAFVEDLDFDAPGQVDLYKDTDGLISSAPMHGVGVKTADCVPLMLYASDINACAAVHAGWRGTYGNIAARAVEMMVSRGAVAQNIFARFGAAICGDCYEVDAELAERFNLAGYSSMVRKKDTVNVGSRNLVEDKDLMSEKYLINLSGINRLQLLDCGLLPRHINAAHDCTLHSLTSSGEALYHSWRRTPGIRERNITFVWHSLF